MFFIFILLLGARTFATIDPQTVLVLNASKWNRPVIQPTTGGNTTVGGGQSGNVTVYGGIMGTACQGDTTCNNCTVNNVPCNAARISPDSLLTFKFRTDNASVITPTSKIFITVNTTVQISGSTGTSAPMLNAEMTLTVKWRDLCNALGASSNSASTTSVGVCDVSVGSKSIQIGISSDSNTTLEESLTVDVVIIGDVNSSSTYQYVTPCDPATTNPASISYNGFCWIELIRGDEKVYLDEDNEYYSGYFNQTPLNGKYSALRVYYAASNDLTASDDNFATTVNALSDFKDFSFTMNGDVPTLNDNKITGLKNGTRYYFMFANVDEAGNVFYFSSNKTTNTTTSPYYLRHEKHSQVPEEVSGALEGKECFIATAAYGSPLAPQLDILRAFRDRYLNTNALGRWFVKKYYKYGPGWAQKIKNRESARAAVRGVLNPIVSAAQWVILYGLKSFILISFVGFFIGFLILRRVIRDHE